MAESIWKVMNVVLASREGWDTNEDIAPTRVLFLSIFNYLYFDDPNESGAGRGDLSAVWTRLVLPHDKNYTNWLTYENYRDVQGCTGWRFVEVNESTVQSQK
jgi:hypothetical protein